MDQRYTNDTMFCYYQDLDENLVCLTQKTEEPKSNKGNFTFPKHRVDVILLHSDITKTNKVLQET